jgi:phosphatidylserine/phosphatidylglycerophosphate/cardiolipin synthase-like enzyme
VLRNGDQIFPAMVKASSRRSTTSTFSTYIYWTRGPTITEFGDALAERAAAGVEVSILLDGVGSAAKIDHGSSSAGGRRAPTSSGFVLHDGTRSTRPTIACIAGC